MARRYRKKTHKGRYRVGARYKGVQAYAEYDRGTIYEDGEETVSTYSLNADQTQAIIIHGTTDMGTASSSNDKQRRCKIANFSVDFEWFIAEAAVEQISVQIWMWLMLCPAVVATDWSSNSRDPNDILSNIVAANPYRILAKKFVHLTNAPGNDATASNKFNQYPARGRLYCKAATARYPDNLYLMINSNVINDGGTAGITANSCALTWKSHGRLYTPNKLPQ